jgi:hypothetical protein
LFTATQLQSLNNSGNSLIQGAMQSLADAGSAYRNGISTAGSKFSTCILQMGAMFALFSAFPCTIEITSPAVTSITVAVTDGINKAMQFLSGLSANTAAQTAAPAINTTTQLIQQAIQSATNQAINATNLALTCIKNATNPTAANATSSG